MRAGQIIAGAPVILVGDYVVNDFIPDMVRTSVKRSFAEQTTAALNAQFTDTIRTGAGPTRIDLFTGDADHFLPKHPDAVAGACASNPRVELCITIAADVTHASMYRPWSRHLEESLRWFLGPPATVLLGSAATAHADQPPADLRPRHPHGVSWLGMNRGVSELRRLNEEYQARLIVPRRPDATRE